MLLLRWLNPIFIMNLIFKMIKEVDHFIFYNKKIKDMKKSRTYKLYDVRIDYLNTIYTVVNMQPELLLAQDKDRLEAEEKKILGYRLTKLDKLLQEYKIYEFIKYKYKRILNDNYYAYQVWTKFKFKMISYFNLIYITAYVFLFYKIVSSINWINLFDNIKELF